jgi:transcriptional regulator with XRE-family HTH domain
MADTTGIRARLGAELRAARTLANLTQRQLAARIEPSQATVTRVERGEVLLSRPVTVAWLEACDANADARARVLALTEAAHNETRPWADAIGGDTLHLQEVARRREADARVVRNYQTSLVPGLLQTAGYARQLLPLADPTGAMDHAAALAARLERQQVLYEPDRRFEFLLEEMVLRWAPGPGVMRAQVDRLLSLATLETVELAVLPAARIGAMSWHSFMWWEPVDGPPYVTTELLHGGQYVTDATAVASYETVWSQLWKAAVVGSDALDLIRRTAA